MLERCYVASPINFFYKTNHPKIAISLAKKRAINLSLKVKQLGYIPISAPLLFLDLFDEKKERQEAFKASLQVLCCCQIFAYCPRDLEISKGIREELEEAHMRGMKIIELND